MDGYGLIRRVRQLPGRTAAIAVSAYARPEDRERALDSGFDAYCSKPVDTSELMRTVRQVLLSSAVRAGHPGVRVNG